VNFLYNDLSIKQKVLSLGIITNTKQFESVDKLVLSLGIVNPIKIREVDLYLVLRNTDSEELWFYPNWTGTIQPIHITLPKDLTVPMTEVLSLDIPCENPPMTYDIQKNWIGHYAFYFAVFDSGNNGLLDIKDVRFYIYPPE
jgi:hypothetical protein